MNERRVVVKVEGLPVGTATVKQDEHGWLLADIVISERGPNVGLIHSFFEESVGGVSIENPKVISEGRPQSISIGGPPHNHSPVQHRDGREPWCETCQLNKDYGIPKSLFRQ